MAVATVSSLVVATVSRLVAVWRESLQLQGARGLDLHRATSGDTPPYQVPELELNTCMVYELFVQILASGLGKLVVVWATVVLLGGFSTSANSLQKIDFWVITAIVFIQIARVVGLNVNPEAEFFTQVPPAFLKLSDEQFTTWGRKRPFTGQATGGNFFYYIKLWAVGGARNFIFIMAFLALLILVVPTVAGSACIALSIFRLVLILSRNQYGANSNVLRALILFYALVLLQGGLFILWWCLWFYRLVLVDRVSTEYRFEDNRGLIDKYMDRTLSSAIKNGVSSTINGNLVSFAADLIKSEYGQDRIEAVLVLHILASQDAHRTRTLSQIQSSSECIARLLDMVSSKSRIDQKTKICIAQIVADLASNLRLADISGATESISSMTDPYLTKISPATNVSTDQQTTIDINGAENKPLIIHGLLILAKLAASPDNCKEIHSNKGLFSKIIAPVKNKVYKILSDDATTMEITEKSLEVVSMLVSGTDEVNRMVRQDICRNGIAVEDFGAILKERDRKYDKLKIPATKILTELALDMSARDTVTEQAEGTMAESINVLMSIFSGTDNESGLRKTAGEALARLAMDRANCTMVMSFSTATGTSGVQLLTVMLPEADYRTAIAQLLMQFCANSNSSAERERLESVKTILDKVLNVICESEENTNQPDSPQHDQGPSPLLLRPLHHLINVFLGVGNAARSSRDIHDDNRLTVAQLDRRKTLAAFLGLAAQMCDKLLISADDFDTALTKIFLSKGEFVGKLNEIIEKCKCHSVDVLEGKGPSRDYLVIIKTLTKFCAWVMRNNADYITEFQNKGTAEKLEDAGEDMRELERGMLLNSGAGYMAGYETLSSIVEDAARRIRRQQPNAQL